MRLPEIGILISLVAYLRPILFVDITATILLVSKEAKNNKNSNFQAGRMGSIILTGPSSNGVSYPRPLISHPIAGFVFLTVVEGTEMRSINRSH